MKRKRQVPRQEPSLDLHGKNREEAAEELDRFIDHQFFEGNRRLWVITGLGGVLRKVPRTLLPANPLVASWRELWGRFEVNLEAIAPEPALVEKEGR